MKKHVEKGDLLKSNPIKDWWTCSIVLTYQPKSDDFNSMSHVAITNTVFEYDFDFSEVDIGSLKVLYTKNYEGHIVPCIEIHDSKLVKGIEVIGQLSAESYYPHSLEFRIGNGSDGGWPVCGPLTQSIGYQAVHQWRAANDREAWLSDISAAEKSHAEMLKRLKHG